jgi:replicative DNA helicase
MSIGLQFLRSLIETQARTEFSRARPEMFVGDEIAAFNFVSAHYRRHGNMPSLQACGENGIRLPPATDPPAYYLTRITERAIFNAIASEQPALASAMQARDMARSVDVLQRMLLGAGRMQSNRDTATLHEVVQRVLENYERAHLNPGRQGISLGWAVMDELTNGAEPGDIVTLAGRPGMGKSWLMTHIAYQTWLTGTSVLFVSMEMTDEQIARRMLGQLAQINPNFIRRGQMSQWMEDTMYEQARTIEGGAPFHLVSGSFEKSVPLVDAAIQEFAPEVVFIDASYLMSPSGPKGKRAQWELLGDVAKEIKEMAIARNRPIIQSVQLNRDAKKGAKPGTENVAGSDAISQITSIGIGITEGPAGFESTQRKLNIFKNREGETGELTVRFLFNPPDFSYIAPDNTEEAFDDAWTA